MARIRSIKPEFWSDPVIAQLSHSARLLYIGLWNYVDDEGRGQYIPKAIEGFVFPREDLMSVSGGVHELLSELIEAGRIVVYEAHGDQFFHIPSWHQHQKPQHPSESKLPAPDQGKRNPHETVMSDSGDSHETLTPVLGVGEVVVDGEGVTRLGERRRDLIWDTLADLFGDVTNDSSRGARNRAVALLRQSDATPEELRYRHDMWPLHFDQATLTDLALAKHYDTLGNPPKRMTKAQTKHLEDVMERHRRHGLIDEAARRTDDTR